MSAWRSLLRPLLFLASPAEAHALGFFALGALELAPSLAARLRPSLDPSLTVEVMGLTFPSPLGLAGGFDKNAERPHALSALGFGFLELGTVTALAQEQNPEPNLFRLPLDRALINRLGFPNQGAAAVARAYATLPSPPIPVGFSIGKSRLVDIEPIEGAIADYLASFRAVLPVAQFVVVNVSSPNTKNLRALQGPAVARALLSALVAENEGRVPLLLKVAPDLDEAELDALLDVVAEVGLTGVVCSNTTIRRDGLRTSARDIEAIGGGGLSGPPLRERARLAVRRARRRLGEDAVVIGVGGVETAADVVALVRSGADLVQAYTGFIYGGPRFPAQVTHDLALELRRQGASHLRELRDRDLS